ncbi:unnamed protein product [Acanthoscelides obtectus]|uniref:Uncharacterized protein n=1 Tax=Acanthoscelides obtectus TaxID=200917 RepID=A0A9P0VRH9_ACAOB|nr:unnamed protein product [Acanthoscelides obtectus]CAH2018161.1 unnamed protein product [Acanthoscelides obtectus]CAK1631344.1 hypothetical protein AOBTE_LOCUS6894 [Acanthoscelides obtectus]CAK1687869.1 hypothetical protein AOBTE_LOCUS36421 [Acanthoscelides obtectus]
MDHKNDEPEDADVFKPKSSIFRTPKWSREPEQKRAEMMILVREMENIGKRQCYQYQSIMNEELIQNFFEEIDSINKVVDKDLTKNPFSMQDKTSVMYASINLHKSLTRVVYKVSQLEKENLALTAKVEETKLRHYELSGGATVSSTEIQVTKQQ